MKEQKNMKQDFDHWLTRQWVEEEYAPTSIDRILFIQKIKTHKRWKKRVKFTWIAFGLLVCICLLHITSTNKLNKKKTNFIPEKKVPVQRMNNPKETVHVLTPLIPHQAPFLNQLYPTLLGFQETQEVLEMPRVESVVYSEDPIPNAYLQDVDLDSVMKNFGIFYLQSSTSNEGRDFVGVTAGHELVVASLVNGTISLPNSPDTTKTAGEFRPYGMSGHQYVQYSFYDVRQLLFNEAIYRQVLAVNVLPRIAYYMRTAAPGWNNPIGMQMRQDMSPAISNATRNQDQHMRRIARQADPNSPSSYKPGRPFYLRQPVRVNYMAKVGLSIGDNFLIKSQGEKVLVVSCDAERVSVVKEDGVIEASLSISIQHPRFFSQKAKYPFYDEASRRLFLIVETNFAYMWFEVNQLTGETRYIFKTETIWNDPNWAIKDGTLSYIYKGKSYQKRLD
jgi:hypothetical protein